MKKKLKKSSKNTKKKLRKSSLVEEEKKETINFRSTKKVFTNIQMSFMCLLDAKKMKNLHKNERLCLYIFKFFLLMLKEKKEFLKSPPKKTHKIHKKHKKNTKN